MVNNPDVSPEELEMIRKKVGEAFATNELFHNWGSVDDRREDVMKYLIRKGIE